jgi:hypothetical protein
VSRQFLWFSAHTGWLVIAVFTHVLSLSLLGAIIEAAYMHGQLGFSFSPPACIAWSVRAIFETHTLAMSREEFK